MLFRSSRRSSVMAAVAHELHARQEPKREPQGGETNSDVASKGKMTERQTVSLFSSLAGVQ